MRKIPTVFRRDPEDRAHVLPIAASGCEWVLEGEGVATIKYDGTCTLFDGERWWARREVKPEKTPPPDWREVDTDPVTGKRQGWEPIEQSPFAAAFASALRSAAPRAGATYELVGPKINGNPHAFTAHRVIRHGLDELACAPRDYEGLQHYLLRQVSKGNEGYIEGIVWWRELDNPEAGLAKVKIRDFA